MNFFSLEEILETSRKFFWASPPRTMVEVEQYFDACFRVFYEVKASIRSGHFRRLSNTGVGWAGWRLGSA